MGYVFTPREFEEGKIPTLSDYRKASEQLRHELAELCNDGLVYGANIHGSNFHSDYGVGSDVDVLVVLNSPEAVEHLRRLHASVKGSTNTPPEFVPVLKPFAQQGYHPLDYYYVLYMKTYCRDGVVGNDPLAVIAPRETWANPAAEVRERLLAQLTKLSKQRISVPPDYDEVHCRFLEKLMRQPLYAAIDILRIRDGNYPSGDGRPLSKAECCELYAAEFPEIVTQDLFLVLQTRNRYRQFLQEARRKASEYRELLKEIDSIYPHARRVIENNLEFLIASLR